MAWTPDSRPFTAEEDAELLRRRNAGETYPAISAAMVNRSYRAIRVRYATITARAREKAKPAVELVDRKCLRCTISFKAHGRFNRLCEDCGKSAVEASPYDSCGYEVSPRNIGNGERSTGSTVSQRTCLSGFSTGWNPGL